MKLQILNFERIAPSCRLVSAAIFALFAVCPLLSADPRIVCNQPVYHFGTVQGHDSVEHTFRLRNDGDSVLIIERVRTGCGCTTTRLAQRKIQPGKEVELTTRLSLKGRTGQQHKSIYVHSNDPKSPRYRLELAGEVRRAIEVRPLGIAFGEIAEDAVTEKKVHIVSTTATPFHITGIETNDSFWWNISMEPIEEGRKYELKVKPTAAALETGGSLLGKIVVRTDHPQYAHITIPVTAFVRKDMMVIPRVLAVQKSSGQDKGLTRYFLVRSRENKPFNIIGIETPQGIDVNVKTEKLGPGRYRIKISDLQPSKDLDGKIFRVRVKMPDGEEKVLEIHVRVR